MGTHVQLMVCGAGPDLLHDARRTIADYERRWSRFLPDSEVSQINARPGRWTRVSPDTFRLIEAAVTGWRIPGGRFDPTILHALLAAGYDRNFAEVPAAVAASKHRGSASRPVPGAGTI